MKTHFHAYSRLLARTGAGLTALALVATPAFSQPFGDLLIDEIATNPAGGFLTGMLPSPAPGDDALYIVARAGFVYRSANNGEGPLQEIINVSGLLTQGGEGGLLSIAFHPDYGTENTWVFINYTNTAGDTVVGRITMDLSDPSSPVAGPVESVIEIDQDGNNHNGGQIAFGNDGMLYIGMGDGGGSNDPLCRAQDPSSLLGKMLRIDVNQPSSGDPLYTVPADNPFVGDSDVEDEIWATGLRNPWRFSIDPDTGELWIADVGQSTREEVNRLDPIADAGANLGWPVREGDTCNGSSTFIGPCATAGVALPACSDPSLTDPIHVYATGPAGNISITGGYVYRGSAIPTLVGYYIFGDFGSGRVWALDPDTATATELFNLGSGLTTFGLDADGEILVGRGSTISRISAEFTRSDNWLLYR